MRTFTDQTGRTITLPATPKRIISLVPSQTELLFDLGLDEQVVGITKFCVHPPEWYLSKTRVGGTKKLHPTIIHQLEPDLVLANKEENEREQVEEISSHYPVWVSDVSDLDGAYDMIQQIGLITGKAKESKELVNLIKKEFAHLHHEFPKDVAIPTAYLIWNDPYMTIGADTFIHSMLEAAGFQNSFADKTRYPEITIEELKARNLKYLLLSSEPYPFKQKHIDQLQPHLPATEILIVDGEMFSWYGSRLQYAPRYFRELRKKIEGLISLPPLQKGGGGAPNR